MKRHVAFCAGMLYLAGLGFAGAGASAKTLGDSDNKAETRGGEVSTSTGWERPKLLQQIRVYEDTVRQGEASHAPAGSLAKVYVQLASLYADVAMYPRAEEAIQRGVVLLRRDTESKRGELAAMIDNLATLHVSMGDLDKAEKEGQQALQLRLQDGDRVAIGASYRQLAALYLRRHSFRKSVEFGERAMDSIGTESSENADDWVAVRYTLAKALCENGSCGRAIPVLQQGIEQAKASYGESSLPVGMGYFQLGVTYWRDGQIVDAARWLERGAALMKADLNWGHPTYINALREYAKFLRKHGTEEAALVVEREVRQADAVVDVSRMAKMPGGVSGLR
jgi:tetratricopeptide (TPR) repeat protein